MLYKNFPLRFRRHLEGVWAPQVRCGRPTRTLDSGALGSFFPLSSAMTTPSARTMRALDLKFVTFHISNLL